MSRFIPNIPWRTPVIAALFFVSGLGPVVDGNITTFLYLFFMIPLLLLETEIGPRIWSLSAAGLAGALVSMHLMDVGMHFDAGVRALFYTVLFAILWVAFRKAGLFAASLVMLVFACSILDDFQQHSLYAIPYMIGYGAGLCWLGIVQIQLLCAELHILNLRNGSKMY